MSKRLMFLMAKARKWFTLTGFLLLSILSLLELGGVGTASATPTFTITWDASESEDAEKYRIYRATSLAGPFSLLKTTTATTARVEVPVNETRCLRIKTVDVLGQTSPYSGYVCITINVETGE